MKATKHFNMSLYYSIIRSILKRKTSIEDELKKTQSVARKQYLQEQILEQDHIIQAMESNSSVFLEIGCQRIIKGGMSAKITICYV